MGPPTHEVHGDAMLGICGHAQREGHFVRRLRPRPSNPMALSSTNSSSLISIEISAILVLKRAPSRRIVNITLPLRTLTYLSEIDQSPRMITLQVDRHVKVPKDEIAFLEFVGLVFGTSIILEDKLEVGLWSSLKIDRYFYENISCLL